MKYLELGAALGARCFWICSLRDSVSAGTVSRVIINYYLTQYCFTLRHESSVEPLNHTFVNKVGYSDLQDRFLSNQLIIL
jgi:hypothetical protein